MVGHGWLARDRLAKGETSSSVLIALFPARAPVGDGFAQSEIFVVLDLSSASIDPEPHDSRSQHSHYKQTTL